MRNTWKKLNEKYELNILDYDYDMNEDEVKVYNVGDKLPVTIFFDDDDNEVLRLVGEKTFDELDKTILDLKNKGV